MVRAMKHGYFDTNRVWISDIDTSPICLDTSLAFKIIVLNFEYILDSELVIQQDTEGVKMIFFF